MRILILSLLLLPLFVSAQLLPQQRCNQQDFPFLPVSPTFQSLGTESVDSIGTFQIKLYFFRGSPDYNNPSAEGKFLDALDQTNRYFAGLGMQFALCGSPIYVDSVSYAPNGNFVDWFRENADPRYIHVIDAYVPFAGGTAGFPGNIQWITMYPMNAQTLAHELGHNFGLYHTFSTFGHPITQELVNGANCDTTGDLVCDTPADPYPQSSFDSCRYTGTATDANGDPYQPDVFNIMSYYQAANLGCGPENISLGQAERMQGIWRQDLFYLHRGDSKPSFRGIPGNICVGDSTTHTLIGFPAGGTFSGPGLTGNTLHTGHLAAGAYEITYHPPARGPVQSYQKFDALQPAYGAAKDTNNWWQGFTASENAHVEAIHFRAIADSNIQFQWAIYKGMGTQGTPLYQQTDTLQSFQDIRWHRIHIRDSSFTQMKDSIYSLAVWTQGDPIRFTRSQRQQTFTQLNGSMSSSPTAPFWANYTPTYAIEITSTEALCQGPVTYKFAIVNAFNFDFSLEDRFCVADANPVLDSLLSPYTTLVYSDRKYLVNQIPDSLIRLDQLGPGQHQVQMSFKDYNGCSAERNFPINISDAPSVMIPEGFCEGDPAFPLTGLWPDAQYSLNGMSIDSIQPSQIPPGSYQLDMWLPQVYDTTQYITERLQQADSGYKQYFISTDSLYYQSFRPTHADYFRELGCRIALLDSTHFVSFLYKGHPTQGQLLWSDTSWLEPVSNQQYPPLLLRNDFLIPAEKDSLYTLVFKQISTNRSALIIGGIKNPYPRGQANVVDTFHPNIDWLFQVSLQAEKNCGSAQNQTLEIYGVPQVPQNLLQGPDSAMMGTTRAYYWPQGWADSLSLAITGGICMNCPPAGDSIYIQWDSLGIQTISVQNWNQQGCEGETAIKTVTVGTGSILGIGEKQPFAFQLFPNPSKDEMFLKGVAPQSGTLHWHIIDMQGRTLSENTSNLYETQRFEQKIDLSTWPKGSYILELRLKDKVWRQILVKI